MAVTLVGVLHRAAALGYLGGDLDGHLAHAEAFRGPLGSAGRVADLGPGGGVPGLVLAERDPDREWVLIEGSVSRAAFLQEAVDALGWADRVTVRAERAEVAGHDGALRASFDAVVARAFGPPAVVAECAAPLLRLDGRAVVSEPPSAGEERWPAAPLAEFGLTLVERRHDPNVVVLARDGPCPDRYPRRVGVPAKRPRF